MAAQRPENINEIILDTAEELLKVNSFSEVTLAKIAEKAHESVTEIPACLRERSPVNVIYNRVRQRKPFFFSTNEAWS